MPGRPDACAYAIPTGTSIAASTSPVKISCESHAASYRRRVSTPGSHWIACFTSRPRVPRRSGTLSVSGQIEQLKGRMTSRVMKPMSVSSQNPTSSDEVVRSAQGQFQPRASLPPTRAVIYERIAIESADSPQKRIGGVLSAVKSKKSRDLTLDVRKREQGLFNGHSMLSRFSTAQSTAATRRWGPPVVLTLAAMAALTALTAGAVARQRPAPLPKEAAAPRDVGEPIMAIVSIKSQQVTFYDADGWILRAQNPAVGVVESDLLGLDRHDRHDRLTDIARRRSLFG